MRASTPALSLADVLDSLRRVGGQRIPATAEAKVGDKSVLVIAAAGTGDTRFCIFFSLRQLEDSLS